MWFPIAAFAMCGFEHGIANMAFVPLGLMYGAKASYTNWLYQNFILVLLGNLVGGGLIMGGSTYLLYNWAAVVAPAAKV